MIRTRKPIAGGRRGGIRTAAPLSLAQRYQNAINTEAPLLWLRLRETSGTTPVNSGSTAGLAITWTAGVGAVGQTGKLGANEAYDFDGANSKIQITNDAAFQASIKLLTTQRGYALVNTDTLGESSAGVLIAHGGDFARTYVRFASTNRIAAEVDTATQNAVAITNNSEVADFIGAWRLLFWDYDDANAMGLGRRLRLFKSTPGSGVITPLTLATDTAATGAVVAPTADMVVGNLTTQVNSLDGKLDELVLTSGLWTPAAAPTDYTVMQNISRAMPT